jgi:hypothetical protein
MSLRPSNKRDKVLKSACNGRRPGGQASTQLAAAQGQASGQAAAPHLPPA